MLNTFINKRLRKINFTASGARFMFAVSTLVVTCAFVFTIHTPKAVAAEVSSANSYFVSPTGSDSNSGTINSPWKTLKKAIQHPYLMPGDTVYLRAGTYSEGEIFSDNKSQSGLEDSYITYKNYPGETPILKATSITFKDVSYVRVEGLKFIDLYPTSLSARAHSKSISGIEFVNNDFENTTSRLNFTYIRVSSVDSDSYLRVKHVLLEGNTFTDNANSEHDTSEAIQIGGNVDYVKLLNNTLTNVKSIGIGIVGRPWKNNDDVAVADADDPNIDQPDYFVLKGNIVINPTENGIYLDASGDNFVIEQNVVIGGTNGLKVGGEPPAASLSYKRGIVRNNLIANSYININAGSSATPLNATATSCDDPIQIDEISYVHNTLHTSRGNGALVRFYCGKNLRFKNNILSDIHSSTSNRMYQQTLAFVDDSSWEIDNNLFYFISDTKQFVWKNKKYVTLLSFGNATGHDSSPTVGDPLYSNPENNNYTLRPGSPAIDSAIALTKAVSAGSGIHLQVADASYFTDGWTLQSGDLIKVGDSLPVRLVEVDYDLNTLTLSEPRIWKDGDDVTYDYASAAPDLGAYESNYILPPPCTEGCGDTEVIILKAIADTKVDSKNPNTNYGSKKYLQVVKNRQSMLVKFELTDLGAREIVSAKLKYKVNSGVLNGTSNTYKVVGLEHSNWNENTVTYNTSPLKTSAIAEIHGSNKGETVEVDVTNYILSLQEQPRISLSITDTDGNDNLVLHSRDATFPPVLELTVK